MNSQEYMEIRGDVIESLVRYVVRGIPTGGFLRAVLSNDLMGAYSRADLDNIRSMRAIVTYVYSRCPMDCRGSHEVIDEWKGVIKTYDANVDLVTEFFDRMVRDTVLASVPMTTLIGGL